MPFLSSISSSLYGDYQEQRANLIRNGLFDLLTIISFSLFLSSFYILIKQHSLFLPYLFTILKTSIEEIYYLLYVDYFIIHLCM